MLQIFYTFSAYFMAGNPSKVSSSGAFVVLIFGSVSIILNYVSDGQKEAFRTSGGKCSIWGRTAKFLVSKDLEPIL